MALLDGWVTAMDVALLGVSGVGKVSDGLGRGKKERADVASTADLSFPFSAQKPKQTHRPFYTRPPPSKSRYYAHSPLLFFLSKTVLAYSNYQNRYWFVSFATSSCDLLPDDFLRCSSADDLLNG